MHFILTETSIIIDLCDCGFHHVWCYHLECNQINIWTQTRMRIHPVETFGHVQLQYWCKWSVYSIEKNNEGICLDGLKCNLTTTWCKRERLPWKCDQCLLTWTNINHNGFWLQIQSVKQPQWKTINLCCLCLDTVCQEIFTLSSI